MNEYRGFLNFPDLAGAWTDLVSRRVADALTRVRHLVERLKDGSDRDPDDVVNLWNGIDVALREGQWLAAFLAEVHPDRSLRTLAEEGYGQVQNFANELKQDAALYGVLTSAFDALVERPRVPSEDENVEAEDVRLLRVTLRDFRRAGVELDDATRERLRELVDRETKLGQDFGRAVREDVRSIRLDPSRLVGLPEDFVVGHPVGDDGLVEITTDYPDSLPFTQFCDDAEARRELMVAFLNRGWPENDETLRELVSARGERARLLGYAGWPDFVAEDKMLNSSDGVVEFIDRIAGLAREGGEHDRDELLARLRRDRPSAAGVDAADRGYYGERLRRENYDVDSQAVRQYFDFDAVRRGLLEVTGRLFGLRFELVDAPTWHSDVVTYDVSRVATAGEGSGELIGRIHLDLFPRDGKFKHAAQFPIVAGVIAGRGVEFDTLPESALACNFSRGFMEHSDVVTLFHEFGHLIHEVLGSRQRFARFSGTATEWDFVEAPSQMLEEWAWSHDVLQLFAFNSEREPIPASLVARMNAARDFGKSAYVCTQMFYAAVSYYLHASETADITAAVRDLRSRYDVFEDVPETHLHASFGHLDEYSSVYYTYMWSSVIAKDLYSAFDPNDLLETSMSFRYRDAVLARGGARDAADLVADFLGRPYSFASFARWLAEESSPVA